MSTVRKTVTVTETQGAWITAQVAAGRFTHDSELIRDLIRREPECASQVEALRQAWIEGERSGEPQPFDFSAFTRRKSLRCHCTSTVTRSGLRPYPGGAPLPGG
ncbi:MAG: type II toxin-antitoxin system ParD family antitoxin [Proteobacteria bacterium]|nr:type II toxin-antitoxin system ParD family antitoxin [Pseudomonadota bacterium]